MRTALALAFTIIALGQRPNEGVLVGRVTTEVNGVIQPVPAATLIADWGRGQFAIASSGTDGQYRVPVPAGACDVLVFLHGFTPVTLEKVDVAEGADVRRDIVLRSTAPATAIPAPLAVDAAMEIDVADQSGTPTAASMFVFGPRAFPAMSTEGLGPHRVATETKHAAEDGHVRLAVAAGEYTLWFRSASGPVTAVQNVVVQPGETRKLKVTLAAPAPDVRVRIETPAGSFDIVVQPSVAPITAGNFLKYVDGGFYTGGRFHRATRDGNYAVSLPNRPLLEVIQAGINPERKSEGFAPIPLEPTTVTKLTHVVGTVAMARGAHSDTATSDFFVLLNDQPSLDLGGRRFDDWQGSAAFGHVVAGMDVVRKIQQLPTTGQNLTPPVTILRATRVRP